MAPRALICSLKHTCTRWLTWASLMSRLATLKSSSDWLISQLHSRNWNFKDNPHVSGDKESDEVIDWYTGGSMKRSWNWWLVNTNTHTHREKVHALSRCFWILYIKNPNHGKDWCGCVYSSRLRLSEGKEGKNRELDAFKEPPMIGKNYTFRINTW